MDSELRVVKTAATKDVLLLAEGFGLVAHVPIRIHRAVKC
jgi:hypothetical protein